MTLTGGVTGPRPRVYVGETDHLRRRLSGNYRNPGPQQRTSLPINAVLREHLGTGGTVMLAVATTGTVWLNGAEQPLDLARKAGRLFAENAALVLAQATDNAEIVNLGSGASRSQNVLANSSPRSTSPGRQGRRFHDTRATASNRDPLAEFSEQLTLEDRFAPELPELALAWRAEEAPDPRVLVGPLVPSGATPVAQAYAGTSSVGTPRLGDGRALLLGEVVSADGHLRDLPLKGSGAYAVRAVAATGWPRSDRCCASTW